MTAVNGTLSVWVPVGAALGSTTLFVCCNVVVLCLCVCYCSWCECCPCNRKRGRAQLVVTRKEHGEMRNKDRFQTSNGVTMFVPPRLVNQSSSSTLSTLTPVTPNSSTSFNTCDSYTHLFSTPRTDHTHPSESHAPYWPDHTPSSPTESCSYVLPNNMTQLSDGFEKSTSWQKYANRVGTTPLFILSRCQAEEVLHAHGTVGGYLFRKTADNKVCLSALAEKEEALVCRHLLLVENSEGKIKIDSLPDGYDAFGSRREMEEFYWNNEIHFEDGGVSLSLSIPCTPNI